MECVLSKKWDIPGGTWSKKSMFSKKCVCVVLEGIFKEELDVKHTSSGLSSNLTDSPVCFYSEIMKFMILFQ